VITLTNAEADHLARHNETAVGLLRDLAGYHRSQQDAMHVIGEQLMEWYHETRRAMVLDALDDLDDDARALRERRKPKVPNSPPGLTPNSRPAPARSRTTHHRRQAIEEANTPPPRAVQPPAG